MPTPNVLPVTPLLANAPSAIAAPADFAASQVGGITSFLGKIISPIATLALVGMGLQMIVTGKKPKILGGQG